MNDNNLRKLDNEFKRLVNDNKININSIEDLMTSNIEEYKTKVIIRIEELLKTEINEKELISKKNKNGKKKDMN